MKKILVLVLLGLGCLLAQAQGDRILFIGDSITDGSWGSSDGSAQPSAERNHWDMNHIYGSGYMYLCAAYFQGNYPEKEYVFFNRGISGNTLSDLQKRWQEDALDLEPDVLSVLIGTNDIHYYLDSGSEDPFDFEGWEKTYRSLLDSVLKANPDVRIILGAPFVARTGWVKERADCDKRVALVGRLAVIVERIAADYGAVFLPYDKLFAALLENCPTSQDGYWIWDGIHPTAAGHQKMADLWISRSGLIEKPAAEIPALPF